MSHTYDIASYLYLLRGNFTLYTFIFVKVYNLERVLVRKSEICHPDNVLTFPIVKAISKSILILNYLKESEGGTLSQIAYNLTIPKATVHRIIRTLEVEGMVCRNNEQYELNVFAPILLPRHKVSVEKIKLIADALSLVTGLSSIVEERKALELSPLYWVNIDKSLIDIISTQPERYICDCSSGIQFLTTDSTFLLSHSELVDLVNDSARYDNVPDFLNDIRTSTKLGFTKGIEEWGGEYNTLSTSFQIDGKMYAISLVYPKHCCIKNNHDFYKDCILKLKHNLDIAYG